MLEQESHAYLSPYEDGLTPLPNLVLVRFQDEMSSQSLRDAEHILTILEADEYSSQAVLRPLTAAGASAEPCSPTTCGL
ncbi:hypothetical protein CK223_15345 [Mesorhizobium loti]|nr:hypothetical protein CK223_15345 [Mesorhizobium loti]